MNAEAEINSLMTQLNGLTARQGGLPAPAAPPVAPATPDQVQSIVETAMKRAMPQLMGMVQTLDDFFAKALPASELEQFKAYRDAGAPGLKEMLASDVLHPVAQLLWDEIKANAPKTGEAK